MRIYLAAVTACAALGAASSAAAHSWTVELNGADASDTTGAELGVGYSFEVGKFRLTPLVGGLLYKGDNDRYRRETTNAGSDVCRDTTNGYFAKSEKCDDVAVKAYGKVEAAYRFGDAVELGGGVRVSDDTTPYGLIAARLSDAIWVQGFGGKDYYGAGLSFRF